MMKHLHKLLAILFLLFIGVSCSNSDDEPTPAPVITTYKADLQTLSNYIAIPAQGGSATAVLNQTDKSIQVTVNSHSYTVFTIIFVAVLKPLNGIVGAEGGEPILDLKDKIPNTATQETSITKSFTLTDEQIAIITNNQAYVLVYLTYSNSPSSAIGGLLKKAM